MKLPVFRFCTNGSRIGAAEFLVLVKLHLQDEVLGRMEEEEEAADTIGVEVMCLVDNKTELLWLGESALRATLSLLPR